MILFVFVSKIQIVAILSKALIIIYLNLKDFHIIIQILF